MKLHPLATVAGALMLGSCEAPPKLTVDPVVLTDGLCLGSADSGCTLLANGDGTFVQVATQYSSEQGTVALKPALPPITAERPLEPPIADPASRAPASKAGVRSGVRVLVSIPQQKLYAFRDGELVGTSPVSTGKRGHATPAGTFRILQKAVTHHSNRYSNAPMPYMQKLTTYGIAIHAGRLPGYPASHGCIRLPRAFAKKLYGMTKHGTVVTITRARPKLAAEALTLA